MKLPKTSKEFKDMVGLKNFKVEFVKKDGSIRELSGTLNLEYVPSENQPKGIRENKSEKTIPVYEHDVGWRTINIDTLKKLEITDESKIKYMDIKEFREKGYLQELNRLFLHPLGLALEVKIDDDGAETIGGIWDYRDDPEGIYYDIQNSNKKRQDRFIKNKLFVDEELNKRKEKRKELMETESSIIEVEKILK